jgi:signal transduction histidine kinase
MNSQLTTFFIHIIGWCLLLLMPCLTTYWHLRSFELSTNITSLLPILIVSIINLMIFYSNYFYLIPRFLFAKKYINYSFLFFSCLAVSYVFAFFNFHITGFAPERLEAANPILRFVLHTGKANAFQMSVVSLVTSLALAYSNRLKQIEQQKLSAQLASLKSQINPHFLFNTLNNIYATALDSSPKSADMVEKLSEMMRYTMKDTQKDFVMLEDEMNYLNNYIALQKIRLDKSVKIEYHNPADFSALQIAPMLLIPFIENAFKHGVNSEQKSHIKINMELQKKELYLYVSNNKVTTQQQTTERSGLGIENTRSRLQLIYPAKHLLTINESDKYFEVSLHINLS